MRMLLAIASFGRLKEIDLNPLKFALFSQVKLAGFEVLHV